MKEPPAFTVNASGKKVKFAPGNLYWDGTQFKFEEHQYDYPTAWNTNHVGHFFYSKDARVAYAAKYADANTEFGITPAVDDKFFAADGGAIEGYTVLSKDEWDYLFSHALAKNSSSKNTITIADKICLVLKPDGFSGTVADTYTAEQWANAEATGLVALPFTGYRDGSSIKYVGSYGRCLSSTPYPSNADRAYFAHFNSDDAFTRDYDRFNGCSVRLVSVQ